MMHPVSPYTEPTYHHATKPDRRKTIAKMSTLVKCEITKRLTGETEAEAETEADRPTHVSTTSRGWLVCHNTDTLIYDWTNAYIRHSYLYILHTHINI